jgi:hypothetical protein
MAQRTKVYPNGYIAVGYLLFLQEATEHDNRCRVGLYSMQIRLWSSGRTVLAIYWYISHELGSYSDPKTVPLLGQSAMRLDVCAR